MSENEEYTQVTVNNYKRLIQIAEIVGSSSAGSSMGGVLRDRMRYRDRGIEAYIEGIQELMHYAEEHGIGWLTTELMSSFAEPPCSAEEMTEIGSRLSHYHERHPDRTSRYGFCADISHGWVNENMEELQNNEDYFHAAAPYLYEFHFKNTDRIYHETFGFERENLKKGIVDVRKIRSILFQNQDKIPVNPIVGYLELPGPKLGRDYSDIQLDRMLRESLRHIKKEFFQK
jgi:ribulose-phosphate 3-epimerase